MGLWSVNMRTKVSFSVGDKTSSMTITQTIIHWMSDGLNRKTTESCVKRRNSHLESMKEIILSSGYTKTCLTGKVGIWTRRRPPVPWTCVVKCKTMNHSTSGTKESGNARRSKILSTTMRRLLYKRKRKEIFLL